ncbi:D-alanyl-D-alanine carboxypeptidase [Streptomyces sp. NPDC047072]|uniref:D-alanyl-D-alanine carboxypeptidase n=1 Tax=Streptomyces sp. NPDC047072 TaxID=3154809 RepID=UPI0033C52A24
MEEASVAGESPDRSKQRESSAEPTSGSAGAVPVPETGGAVRDPRLSVARESVTLGGVDTATRIFSVRELPRDGGGPSGEPTGAVPGPGGASGGAEGALRAGESATEAPEAGEADEGGSRATGGESRASVPEDASGDAAGEESGAGVEAPSEAGGTAEGGTSGAEDDSEVEGGDSSSTAPEDDAAGEEPEESAPAAPEAEDTAEEDSGAEDGESRSVVPEGASVDAAGEEPEESASGDSAAGGDAGTEGAAEDAGGDKSEGSEESASSDSEAASGDADAEGVAEDAGGDESEGSEESASGDSEAAGGDAGAEGGGGSDAPGAEAAGGAESPVTDPENPAETSDDSPERDEPTASGDSRLRNAVAAWVASADEKPTEPEAEGDPEPESATAAEPAADTDGESDSPGARGTARPAPTDPQPTDKPVDQPTAVFKAVRPPVDQPTTMLKLGKAEPEAKSEPEAPAERTSKFVALKPLDEPRAAHATPPKAKADVTAAVPQVGPERTTQQPLPPKPPLDLLAELTNTPPPPPSPFRTLARRIKIWTPLVLLLVIVFAVVQALRPLPSPKLALTAEETYTFDGAKATLPWPSQGQGWMDVNGIGTMGNFGKQTPVGIGSVAKAMTAYIVLKDHPLKSGEEGPKITVDALAAKEGGYNEEGESTLSTVKTGDVLTERQAITAIMIPSANNIARLLARWDAGSEAAFIKKMNATAKELGMTNTTYTDASGLKETTVSTAEDQVKLGNELVRMDALMEITSMGQWTDPSGKKWYNYNYLVPYNGAIGIKTGTTTAAGGNLLFAARKEVGGETVTVVGAILGQHKSPIIQTVNDVSKTAMLAAQDALKSAKILKKGDVVGYVDDGLGDHTPVVLTKDVTAVGWAGMKVKLALTADDVPHSAKAGTKVGTLTVGDEENGAVKVPVTLQKDLTEPGLTAKLKRLG